VESGPVESEEEISVITQP